jgi:uncharacterized protein YndB with AHSA1/START domain
MSAVAPVRKELRVNASQAHAFNVFTARMTSWWPATHTILKSPLKDTVLEPWVGGRWYAVGEDGSTCQTGHVIEWRPPECLVLAWQINADWQFDEHLITEVEVRFIAESDAVTRVLLEHRNLHRMGIKAVETRSLVDAPRGWSAILESFRKHAEAA